MSIISEIISFILHLDKYLNIFIMNYGIWVYAILFFIILIETGLVVTPFLPGDSLIFASAAFAASGVLNLGVLLILLSFAAIIGDTLNYNIGKYLGSKLLLKGDSKFIKKEHIEKTNSYYDKYGGKTLVLARFIPIVRTFAPFVAGIGSMKYKKFISYNAIGGIVWVFIVSMLGYFFGNISFIKSNFSMIFIFIVIISIVPIIITAIKGKVASNN
ncbi:DedA family protein [Clostridium sp.]|uniref:DedA family protein n=1 Tax=Clostridium sp. TaxID=1506 RepID=UPI0026DB4AC4|nr:DedA family protein [Clostridium sp.]MDO5038307.1 DedA family protein [Clostridium sp.]